jgi:glyoxylase-like metal-dependent hydrolase (beta-lactamase superfamily II)
MEANMKMQKLGAIEISKVTELPGLAMQATSLMPDITADILAEGRTWLGPQFIDPAAEIVYLSFHSYVVKTPRHNILVDTCCGNDKPRQSMPAWHMLNTPYLQELAALSLRPEDIDIVLCTHLHADHVGWNTRLIDGRWVPTFPNARYIMGKHEYEHWHRLHAANPPTPVNRGSFADSVLPVVERGQAMIVASDFCVDIELGEGVWLEPSPGHSPGHVCVHVTGGGEHALLAGDAIHHPLQLTHPNLSIAADFDRAQAEATRRHMLERCADTPTLLLTAHFPSPTVGRVIRHKDSFRFKFADH